MHSTGLNRLSIGSIIHLELCNDSHVIYNLNVTIPFSASDHCFIAFEANYLPLKGASRNYSASALLAMQSAVLARGILSVRLSVCLSVTFRYCVQTNEDTIVRFQRLLGQSL